MTQKYHQLINTFSMRKLVLILIVFLATHAVNAQENKSIFNPPEIITKDIPFAYKERYSITSRLFTGIPSMAVTDNGQMWAVWYAGPTAGEDKNNYVVVSRSTDMGNNWGEVMIIDPDGSGDVRAFDPEVWIDPTGKLWIFWTQAVGYNATRGGVWAINCKNPSAEFPKWSKPTRLTDGVMMCKPLVLSSGEWVLPASTWRDTDNSAKMIVSTNKGKTWNERGAANVPNEVQTFDEHMIVEKNDGTLWMLIRTNYGIGESYSKDRGKTWSEVTPSKISHPSARSFIRRLKSNNLLLVKHGPMDFKTNRSHLMAFISKDDGITWSKGLLLDERANVSYPDGQQSINDTIYITYDYNRFREQEIYLTYFTEDEILSESNDRKIVDIYNRRTVINRGSQSELRNISKVEPLLPTEVESLVLIDVRTEPPVILIDPGAMFQDDARSGAMIIGMDRTARGRLWGCWTGSGDKVDGYFLLATSDDDGNTWSKPRLAVGVPDLSGKPQRGSHVGGLWTDPLGRLWLFFDQNVVGTPGPWADWFIRCDNPDANNPVWSKPVYLALGRTLNKPTVLSNGDWLLPVSDWEKKTAWVYVSTDQGQSWKPRGSVMFPDWNYDEQMMVEMRDGRLWMLARTTGNPYESFSADQGATWSEPKPAATIKNVSARFFLRRLKSGNILLVKNGSPTERLKQRSHMSAFLSSDDGQTWQGGLVLDERAGVSYPDGFESPDGLIHILYDRNRHTDAEILLAKFREKDVLAGKLVSRDARLKTLANKATGLNQGKPLKKLDNPDK